MARAAYITRRGNVYWLQKRIILPRGHARPPCVTPTIRFSLRTREYPVAVRRMLTAMETIMGYEEATMEGWAIRPPDGSSDHVPDLAPEVRFVMSEIDRIEADIDHPDRHARRRAVESVGAAVIERARAIEYPVVEKHREFWPLWHGFIGRQIAIEDYREQTVRRFYEMVSSERDVAHRPKRDTDVANVEGPMPDYDRASRARVELERDEGRAFNEASSGRDDLGAEVAAWIKVDAAQIGQAEPSVETFAGATFDDTNRTFPETCDPLEAVEVPAQTDRALSDRYTAASDPKPRDGRFGAAPTSRTPLSEALTAFLAHRREIDGDDRARDDVALPVQFMIKFLGDPALEKLDRAACKRVDAALVNVPNRNGIPRDCATSLHDRYEYARVNGWSGLKRMSRKRIKDSWHRGLHSFLAWAEDLRLVEAPHYRFKELSHKNLQSKAVDAWSDDEVRKLFSLPLFTGCRSEAHCWTEGNKLVQSGLYWAYIVTFFTGMRASEIGRLQVDQVVEREGRSYFDIRSRKSDASEHGDVTKPSKTDAGMRLVPIPGLLVDLGLLDHAAAAARTGETRLFPDWHVYERPDGRRMWGHHFSKSWNYVRAKFDFERTDLRLHGGRHTRAGWYDSLGIPDRVRDRVLGHQPKRVAGNYGPNLLTNADAALIAERTLPIEEEVAEMLITAKLRADYGKLKLVRILSERS